MTKIDANKVKEGVTWPAIVWVITLILFRIGQLVNQQAGSQFAGNLYPITVTIGLVLGVWTGLAVKEGKGSYVDAILGGVILGLACDIPAIILFGTAFLGFAINITIFSFAVVWASWNFRSGTSK